MHNEPPEAYWKLPRQFVRKSQTMCSEMFWSWLETLLDKSKEAHREYLYLNAQRSIHCLIYLGNCINQFYVLCLHGLTMSNYELFRQKWLLVFNMLTQVYSKAAHCNIPATAGWNVMTFRYVLFVEIGFSQRITLRKLQPRSWCFFNN